MNKKYNYVYRLTLHLPEGTRYYVGKHTGLLDDLRTGKYKTSSKPVKKLLNEGIDFDYKIVKIFDDPAGATEYEVKYHKRLDVKNHSLFLNLSNQTSNRFDATGFVTVFDKEVNEDVRIPTKEYRNNKDRYVYDKIVARDKNTNEVKIVSRGEFERDSNLVGVNSGRRTVFNKKENKYENIYCSDFDPSVHLSPQKNKVIVRNKITGENVKVSTDQYHNNPDVYESTSKGKVAARNKITGQTFSTTVEELKNNSELEHVNYGKVMVRNKKTGEILRIDKKDFDRNIYESTMAGLVTAIDIRTNKVVRVSKDEFRKSDFLKGLSYNKGIYCYDFELGKPIWVNKDEFNKLKNKRYFHPNSKLFKSLNIKSKE